MMRRLHCLQRMLAVLLLLSILSACTVLPDDYVYRADGDGWRIAAVGDGLREASEITLPDRYLGRPVIAINAEVFADFDALTILHLGANLREIAPTAFYGCDGLREITLSAEHAYLYVENNCLIERQTGRLILGGQNGDIPSAVRSIAPFAFAGRASLEAVTLPEGLTSLGQGAFCDCPALASICIGAAVTANLPSAISPCPALAEIIVSPDNPVYRAEQNCLILRENGMLLFRGRGATLPEGILRLRSNSIRADAAGGEVLILPEGVAEIDEYAIRGDFAEIYLPASVGTIVEGGLLLNGTEQVVIHCAADTKPQGWHARWYIGDNVEVRWGENFNKFPPSS